MYSGTSTNEILFPPTVIPALPGYSAFEPVIEGVGKDRVITGLVYLPIVAWVIAPTADREDGTLLDPNVRPVSTIGPLSDLYGILAPGGTYSIPDEDVVESEPEAIEILNRLLNSNVIDFDTARLHLRHPQPEDAA